MSAQLLRPGSSPAWMTLCRSCLLRTVATTNRPLRRSIHLSTLKKREDARLEWEERAEKVKKGELENLWEVFKERGYVKDMAGKDKEINELMRRKRIGVYVGIDPTAASLHVGHLLPLMPLFWMYMHGYRAITVVGGATAKVGDPTDRLTTREETGSADRAMYVTKIHYQLKRLWRNVDAQAERFGHKKIWAWNRELVNNSAWYNSTPFTEIVTRLFKGMRVGPMLSRETVKRKMSEGDGMSLAEFVYPMMQAWDWWEMFSGPKGVCMQIGGSDQYGNIVAGIDAVKLLRDTEPDPAKKLPADLLHTPVGFTTPLVTDSSGAKFGKSAGNAVWLDPFMTYSFDLYGYFMRRPDADVEQLLKYFTFYPIKEIKEIMRQHNEDPSKRHAQHILAYEVLALCHGKGEAEATQQRHKMMFGSKTKSASANTESASTPDAPEAPTTPITPTSLGEVETFPTGPVIPDNQKALNFRPDVQLPESLIMGSSISRILYAAGLAESANDAHRLVAHQGAYVGGAPGRAAHEFRQMDVGEVTFQSVKSWFKEDTEKLLIGGKILILRRGKHFIRIVEMVSDEEWEASGKSYPGEAGKGRLRMLRQQLIEANGGKNPNFSTEEISRVNLLIEKMEQDDKVEQKDADASAPRQIVFPPARTRAAQLIDKFTRAQMTHMPRNVEMTVKQKTAAIDKVLTDARAVIIARKKEREAAKGTAKGTTKGTAKTLREQSEKRARAHEAESSDN